MRWCLLVAALACAGCQAPAAPSAPAVRAGETPLRGPPGVYVLEAWGGGDPALALLDREGRELAQDDDGAPELGPRAARVVIALDDPDACRVQVFERAPAGAAPRSRTLRARPLRPARGVARVALAPEEDGWWSFALERAATVVAAVDSRTALSVVSAEDGRARAREVEACRVALAPGRYALHTAAGPRTLTLRVLPPAAPAPLLLAPGEPRTGALGAGQEASFWLEQRAPGPVVLVARARGSGTLDPWVALEAEDGTLLARDDDGAGQGAARLSRSLPPGRWRVRVGGRGAGPFEVQAQPLGTRALPAPLRAGEQVRARLAPRAWQWWRVTLTEGAWSLMARGPERAALALFRGRRQVAWSAEGQLALRLEAGEYALALADLSGAGGEWTVRARPLPGTRRADPCPLAPDGVPWRSDLQVAGARWLAFAAAVPGPWLIEGEPADVGIERADGGEVWGAAGRAVVALTPGRWLARLDAGAAHEGQLAGRAAPIEELAPERAVSARLAADALAVWRIDAGAGGHLRVEVQATCPARLTLLDERGRALTGDARFGPGSAAFVERRVPPGAALLRVEAQGEPGEVIARASWLERQAGPQPGAERWFAQLRLRPLPRVPVQLGRASEGPGGLQQPDPLADPVQEPARSAFSPGGAWIGVEEVTQRAFTALLGRNPSRRAEPDLPVHDVSFRDALDFCRALTRRAQADPDWRGWEFRLPTEEEWEAAARAGGRTPIALPPGPPNRRPFQVRLEEVAWFQSHAPPGARAGPFAVAGRAPNAWGLYDLHGNVAEWCLPGRGLPPPPPGHAPLRGGSWTTDYRGCRVSNRDLLPQSFASASTGLRVIAVRR